MGLNLSLGLFEEAGTASNALEAVRRLGVPDNRVNVITATPYRPVVLGRRHPRQHLGLLALLGALLGVGAALLLAVGTPLLYPLYVGGQPLIPIPPTLIITFELTMLGTMGVTFIGFVLLNRFPAYGKPAYHPRISTGQIGVVTETEPSKTERVESILKQYGALEVQRLPDSTMEHDAGQWRVWLFTVVLILAVLGIVGGLFAMDVIRIPFKTQMAYQPSVGFETGPRLAAPAAAIPVQGPALIAGQPATQPIPADAASLQRGQVLFNENCAVCHGDQGAGDGRLSGYFQPAPANLTGQQVQGLSDQQIYLVITNGFGLMPSLHENLLPDQRWDVVNWVRTLKK